MLVFGRGGAGKSRLAELLSAILELPLTELDQLFWREDLTPTPVPRWIEIQDRLTAGERWSSTVTSDHTTSPHRVYERPTR